MARMSRRVADFFTTIFTEINELALEHDALNLGQGKPDFDGPPEVIEAAVRALYDGKHNQYAPGIGTAALRQAVSAHAARFYGLDIDPARGVVVTPGATAAIFTTLAGLIDRGDEVIVIEPFFDSYVPNITMLGGTPVFVPLHAPDWAFNPDEMRAAFTTKTRAIIINTPHNPTGKVFTRAELEFITALCLEHDVVVISDEVYEHLTFGGAQHIPMATLPDMTERTLTVSSVGKTFSVTGWKLGWVYGAPESLEGVRRAHQFITFAANHPAQAAAAVALNLPGTYFEEFHVMYSAKRDLLLGGLAAAGLNTTAPQGTYFVMADFADVFDGDDM
ncbi:MAG TPA: aminotransferase class I/II-fold pyridoxal phosphate-dependent enzyme, partial [Candidatus Limnocylindrales bacterium]|nr:aminotransferase class I/II-fold pyridoxal phosphate-dependent enzyme [Candidatus Limnocylindrales bacterium]